jgi:hypothetical protein
MFTVLMANPTRATATPPPTRLALGYNVHRIRRFRVDVKAVCVKFVVRQFESGWNPQDEFCVVCHTLNIHRNSGKGQLKKRDFPAFLRRYFNFPLFNIRSRVDACCLISAHGVYEYDKCVH